MIEDINERKKAEEDRQMLEQQLQLAGRLAAVGELAAGVAHELNNPLAAVQAFAQLLTSRDDLDKTVKKDIETIYREAQRATRITGNLLSFARRHRPEKRLVSINEILEGSLELHEYRMKINSIEVITELDAELPMTMADSHQMQQVFVNIITNAEQAMTEAHGRGTLWVRTEKLGEMIRITFTDDGPGIHKENLEHVFDPFFTTKDVGKGTGLGLSICYGIIEGHGGYIHAKSRTEKGANFVIEIPIAREDQHVVEKENQTLAQRDHYG
jgi:signal transduction histidine kinase